jgi:CheY-like chemotaxis protein
MDMPSSLRILVVEDKCNSADWMALMFNCWGHLSAVVSVGEQVLEVAPRFLPDVVFFDIGRPVIDGCEVARQIRRLPGMQKTLLVALIGHDGAAEIQRCKEAGIDSHFLKPVDLAELRKMLDKTQSRRLMLSTM